jgi:hypothetical protein
LAYLVSIWAYRKKEPPLIPGVALVLIIVFGIMYPEPPVYYGRQPLPTLEIKESNYGQIGIAEPGGLRAMFLNGALQSLMSQDRQISFVHYTHGLEAQAPRFLSSVWEEVPFRFFSSGRGLM